MSDVAIHIENLSKLYHLGRARGQHDTLRDSLASGLRGSVSRFRRNHEAGATDEGANTIWALKNIDLEVATGDVVGIIGRNGAGKSTLLKILSRITEPTEGQVLIHGRVGSLLEVGTGFHPELSGRENVYLNGAILGMRRAEIERKFDEIVSFAEVERFLDTPVKRYSSGMYVRLAFAVAAHLEPEILVVDEVLAVGDMEFQRKCLGKMSDVAKAGRTVLFVSHNIAAVEGLCTRAVMLKNGHLAHSGGVKEVIEAYLKDQQTPSARSLDGLHAENPATGVSILDIGPVDRHGQPLPVARSGDDLRLAVTFSTPRPIAHGTISFGLNDIFGTRVTVFYSSYAGFSPNLPPGTHTVICEVPRFQLKAGSYGMDVKIEQGNEDLIFARDLGPLDVESGDYYGTGKLPDPSWAGYFYAPQNWVVAENQDRLAAQTGAAGQE